MRRFHKWISIASCLPLFLLIGCGDAPHYQTPLPNGYAHWSNGGDFGQIVKPTSATGGRIIAPSGEGPNGREQWCNSFGWADQLVVGEVIEYGDRAFVDPPVSQRYMILNTATEEATYFDTKAGVVAAWREKSTSPFPVLTGDHASRTELP